MSGFEIGDWAAVLSIGVSVWFIRGWFSDLSHKLELHERDCRHRNQQIDDKFKRVFSKLKKRRKS